MREILLRGKRWDNGEWVEGSAVQFDKDRCFVMPPYPGASTFSYAQIFALAAIMVDPSTVGQYTGLTDKAGTKAFEHDCIRDHANITIGVIRYGEYTNPFTDGEFTCHIGFYVDWVSDEAKKFLRKDLGFWLKRVEIIGNIHDNPELLKSRGTDDDT